MADRRSTIRNIAEVNENQDKTAIKKIRLLDEEQTHTIDSTIQLNIFSVYWLDEQHSDPIDYYTIDRSKLRGIVDYLQYFTQIDVCEKEIKRDKNKKIFIIVSSSSCLQFMIRIHNDPQVQSIHVYETKTSNEYSSTTTDNNLSSMYNKIQGVYEHPNVLLGELSQQMRFLIRRDLSLHSPMLFSTIPDKTERTTKPRSEDNEGWFTYLLEVLQEIPPAFDGKETFVNECRILYRDDQHALKFIDEFNNKYEPQMAILWYTREGILYTFFNRTLRQQDQHRILLFHFFIYDLSQQLKKEVDKNKDPDWRKGTVYRGQLMSVGEIEFLKKQKLLSINTFLSTTRNINLAKCYAGIGNCHHSRDSPEQSVLFEIRISKGHPAKKPAADIDHLSHFNGAEGEVLFCPTYTFYPTKAEYDENDSVWIIRLIEKIVLREVRFDLLPYLIKLDILLRTLIEKDSPIDAPVTDSNATTSCLATIASEIAFLVREVKLDDNEIVTLDLNSTEVVDTNRSRFQLKALHSFSETTMPRMKSQISPIGATILYDCLATIYKSIGKYQLALENFEKATSYDNNENHAATFNRKVQLAQTYKLSRNYSLAWNICEDLLNETSVDELAHQRTFSDISLKIPVSEDAHTLCENYHICYQYLEYIQKTADLKIYGHQIADDYNNLAQALYQYDDIPQVIECYNRYIEIRKMLVDDSSYLDLACAYKELAAIYSRDSSDTAIESYKQALDQFSHIEDNTAKIHMAMCWCEIGCLLAKHNVGTFIRAFELLLTDTDNESNSFNTHNIAQCYLCLAKSYARSSEDVSLALVTGQQSLRLFLQGIDDALEILGDEQETLKDDLDGYWELLLPLHQRKSHEDGSSVPTKEELYKIWKPSEQHPPLENEQITEMLQNTLEKLRQQVEDVARNIE